MSLINRMLRDLSSRQPAPGDVMSGIQLPTVSQRRGGALGRLGLLLVLVAAFTAGLWWMFGPRPAGIPQPRSAPPGAVVATEAVPAPAAAPQEAPPLVARAPAPAQPAQLKMDTELSTPAAAAPAPEPRPPPVAQPKPRASPPAVEPKPEAAGAGPRAQAPTASRAKEPAEVAAAPPMRSTPKDAELYAEARRALERGDEKAAEVALIDALALNPELHGAREDLGSLRIRQGRLAEAERNVRIGLDHNPDWIGYRRLVARLELARGRPAGAAEALERNPPPIEQDPEYHALLASAYQRLNRHEEASSVYRGLTRVQPEQASWWAGYALSRDALGDVPGALAGYARARQLGGLDPRVLEHIDRRAAVLQTSG